MTARGVLRVLQLWKFPGASEFCFLSLKEVLYSAGGYRYEWLPLQSLGPLFWTCGGTVYHGKSTQWEGSFLPGGQEAGR